MAAGKGQLPPANSLPKDTFSVAPALARSQTNVLWKFPKCYGQVLSIFFFEDYERANLKMAAPSKVAAPSNSIAPLEGSGVAIAAAVMLVFETDVKSSESNSKFASFTVQGAQGVSV